MVTGAVIARPAALAATHRLAQGYRHGPPPAERHAPAPPGPLSLAGDNDGRVDALQIEEELADQAGRHADARALWAAWGRLGADEQRAMTMHYF